MSTVHGVIGSYTAVLLLQPLWHVILPPPYGSQNLWLAAVATVPLLLPLKGIWQHKVRSMTWGGYLLVFYFVIGIMEAWSNPGQRMAALAQVVLSLLFVFFLVLLTRRETR